MHQQLGGVAAVKRGVAFGRPFLYPCSLRFISRTIAKSHARIQPNVTKGISLASSINSTVILQSIKSTFFGVGRGEGGGESGWMFFQTSKYTPPKKRRFLTVALGVCIDRLEEDR